MEKQIVLIPLDDLVVNDAAELLRELSPKVNLRTLDTLHLATHLATASEMLFTKDQRMREAASILGLPLAD